MADNLVQILEGLDSCNCDEQVPTYGVGSLAEEVSTTGFMQPAARALQSGTSTKGGARFGFNEAPQTEGEWWKLPLIVVGGGTLVFFGVRGILRHGQKRIRQQFGIEGLGDSPQLLKLQKKLENALEKARPMKEVRAIQREIDQAMRFEKRQQGSKHVGGLSSRRRRRRSLRRVG